MATKKINQINYAGETYQFVDDQSQAEMLVLEQKVDRLYGMNNTAINEETARAKAAEQAILSTQVAKEAGKGLSTNDFTNYYKGWIDNPPVFTIETDIEPAHSGVVPGPSMDEESLYLQANGTWSKPQDTQYGNATHTKAGLMSYADKIKLDDMDGAMTESLTAETVIGDGVINTTYGNGKTHSYTFNEDGTIDEVIVSSYGKTERFTTIFEDGVIRRVVTE